jgi:hypothetical protein
LQGFEDLTLADTVEVVFGGGREPCGHVEMEHRGELACVNQSRAIRTVGFQLHGIERAGGAEGQEVKKDGLILLKAPLPDIARSAPGISLKNFMA